MSEMDERRFRDICEVSAYPPKFAARADVLDRLHRAQEPDIAVHYNWIPASFMTFDHFASSQSISRRSPPACPAGALRLQLRCALTSADASALCSAVFSLNYPVNECSPTVWTCSLYEQNCSDDPRPACLPSSSFVSDNMVKRQADGWRIILYECRLHSRAGCLACPRAAHKARMCRISRSE
jgi:hypothetical protein